MAISRFALAVCLLVTVILMAGCGHKLVAAKGEPTVAVYPNEEAYTRMLELRKQGGVAGMLGNLGQNFVARQVDDHTPVRIMGYTDKGYLIEVTDGPNKGLKGFVGKENVE